MYSYVSCMYLDVTRMYSCVLVCYSYVLVCYFHVTRVTLLGLILEEPQIMMSGFLSSVLRAKFSYLLTTSETGGKPVISKFTLITMAKFASHHVGVFHFVHTVPIVYFFKNSLRKQLFSLSILPPFPFVVNL